jgi:DNA mismatch repair protein MutS
MGHTALQDTPQTEQDCGQAAAQQDDCQSAEQSREKNTRLAGNAVPEASGTLPQTSSSKTPATRTPSPEFTAAVDAYIADGQTPMMAQYHAIKDLHPGTLLFYRMGDFYELFYDDALKASQILDITLTRRGKKGGNDVPMCGVPFHSCDPYVAKLIKSGNKVAICEQTETPDQAKTRAKTEGRPSSKVLVHREVVRVMTQGTLTEDHLLSARENNYLAAISYMAGEYALAWAELSTGQFEVQPLDASGLISALERLNPREILIPDDARDEGGKQYKRFTDVNDLYRPLLTAHPVHLFQSESAKATLSRIFTDTPKTVYGEFGHAELSSIGAIVAYIDSTQKGTLPKLTFPSRIQSDGFVDIDAATRRNLEIMRTQDGQKKGSLLDTIDMTVSPAGGRMLQYLLSSPLTDVGKIKSRLIRTQFFADQAPFRAQIRDHLKALPDIERAISRLSMKRGGPRDLAMIKDGLKQAETIRGHLLHHDEARETLSDICNALTQDPQIADLQDTLNAALSDSLPALARDGGFIATGFNARLDELREMKTKGKHFIAGLETKYRAQTGVEKLKITYNNMLGYFIEVNAKNADALMIGKDSGNESNPFIHRQTMANAMRFSTPELAELERDILSAGEKSLAIELTLYEDLRTTIVDASAYLSVYAKALATLDVAAGLAELAMTRHYTCPIIDNSLAFDITGGRHPVVEHALSVNGERFMPNNCALNGDSADRLWLLTGPNMAGKSTFLRQNALIAILAQIGSFVPATSAHIGVVDKIYSRVGASDDLARGHSTFMVEMVETAAILNGATDRSLVILDEIGRGTATFDGLSIAWACVEHLHEINQCRGLFATHYHELTALTAKLDQISCHSMQVKEWKGEIVFLHEVGKGAADRSYGIHVAKLAGLPKTVITRANTVLKTLQDGEHSGRLTTLADDLPLFTSVAAAQDKEDAAAAMPEELTNFLSTLDPDSLTPRDALEALYELRSIHKRTES